MSSRGRKRRTFSDSGVESLVKENPTGDEPSPLVDRRRRRSNARQARLVAFPVYGGQPIPPQLSMSSGNMLNPMQYYPRLPEPRMTKNAIYFTLPPGFGDMCFTFSVNLQFGQRITLVSTNPIKTLSFVLNQYTYYMSPLPVDITQGIIVGPNRIIFSAISLPFPICVEMLLDTNVDIDALVKKVIEEFPAAPEIFTDLFATQVDPISQDLIRNAARSQNCAHKQCFELTNFLQNAIAKNEWKCPICGIPIKFDDLRVDPNYTKPKQECPIIFDSEITSMDPQINNILDDPIDQSNFSFDGIFYERDF